MSWIKKLFGQSSRANNSNPIEAFVCIEREQEIEPNLSIEGAREKVLSVGENAFVLTPSIGKPLPETLPVSVTSFFAEFDKVVCNFSDIFHSLDDIWFQPDTQIYIVGANGTWEYQLLCLPRPDSKLYFAYDGNEMPKCDYVFDSMWHYLWHEYNKAFRQNEFGD